MNFTNNLAFHIDDREFEEIANALSERIKGNEMISFSVGKDGGKDGRRIGFSKDVEAWKSSGSKFIVQAKHTTSPIASCSEKSFFGNKSSIINEESEKIKSLVEKGELDYYILYTNRKYTGNADSDIRKSLSEKSRLPIDNIEVIGIETINKWLSAAFNQDIVTKYKLKTHQVPFEFSENDIKEVVFEFKSQLPKLENEIRSEVTKVKYDFEKIPIKVKNEKNKLGKAYYEDVIVSHSLSFFYKIETFLELEINELIRDIYYDIAEELNDLITLKRNEFVMFEEVFNFIYQKLSSNSDFKGNKRYIRFLLHYMYCSCSIGIK